MPNRQGPVRVPRAAIAFTFRSRGQPGPGCRYRADGKRCLQHGHARRHHQLTAVIARNRCAATPVAAAHPPATSAAPDPASMRQERASLRPRRTPGAPRRQTTRARRDHGARPAHRAQPTRSASSKARPGTHALHSRAAVTPAGERHDDLPNWRQESRPKSCQSGPGKASAK
jgi:hypothetical protein